MSQIAPPWRFGWSIAVVLALGLGIAGKAEACGPETDCAIGERSYRVVLPEGTPEGAIVFANGYRSTAARVMQNRALTGLADALGVAFVAAQANGIEWNLPGVPSDDAQEGVDEVAYFDALAADLDDRFGITPSQVMVTGFSSGGMMVWHLACQRGGTFAGYAPMSGTFWEPVPESCPGGPVNLIHYHGTEDPVVPLSGRQIKDAHQGDVLAALETMTRTGGYHAPEAVAEEGLDCTRRMTDLRQRLELCLFKGKHELRVEHIRRAWRILVGQR